MEREFELGRQTFRKYYIMLSLKHCFPDSILLFLLCSLPSTLYPPSLISFKPMALTSTQMPKTPKFLCPALTSLLNFRITCLKTYIGNIYLGSLDVSQAQHVLICIHYLPALQTCSVFLVFQTHIILFSLPASASVQADLPAVTCSSV